MLNLPNINFDKPFRHKFRATRELENGLTETFTVFSEDIEDARDVALDRSPYRSKVEFRFTEIK